MVATRQDQSHINKFTEGHVWEVWDTQVLGVIAVPKGLVMQEQPRGKSDSQGKEFWVYMCVSGTVADV